MYLAEGRNVSLHDSENDIDNVIQKLHKSVVL